MIEAQILSMIAEAALAPSVHNVQPARWKIMGHKIALYEDLSVRLSAGDPQGHDALMSLGAAAEGLSLAASRLGVRLVEVGDKPTRGRENLRFVTVFSFEKDEKADPLSQWVEKRQSWRGAFQTSSSKDCDEAAMLQAADSAVVTGRQEIEALGDLVDDASLGFMRDGAFRKELVSWMRFSNAHTRWNVDGLNADAMQMGKLESLGARFVLGGMFAFLDRMKITSSLLAEKAKLKNASAVVLFHRPRGENPLESGRHFYRLWLKMEQFGFGAAVLAALADDVNKAKLVCEMVAIPEDRRLVSAFRVGRRPKNSGYKRARRSVEDLTV